MWRWIVKQKRLYPYSKKSVNVLKRKWIENHGFSDIDDDCFFCEISHFVECRDCPGILIDIEFRCADPEYHWFKKPIAFYNKLVSLNKKRTK